VNKLVEMVCDLLGKEDAVYLPSGTMCNQIAFRVHCRRATRSSWMTQPILATMKQVAQRHLQGR